MTSLKAAFAFIAVLAAGVCALAMVAIATSDRPDDKTTILVLGPLIGWGFVGTGLYAWYRRPENRTGALMTAVGVTWFIGGFWWSDDPVIFGAGLLFGTLTNGFLVHLFVAFPTGRLAGRFERGIVALGYFLTGVLPVAYALVVDTENVTRCPNCRSNPVQVWDNPGVADALAVGQAVASVLGLLAVLVLLRRRWRFSGPAHRKAFMPLVYVVVLAVVALALSLIASAMAEDGPLAQAIALAGLLGFGAVPFAFLAGLLRGRLSRAGAVDALIARLGRERSSVRDLLAEALDDPGLELAYWARDQSRYVDAAGRPVDLPAPGADRVASEVERDGRPVAVMIHTALQDDPGLVQTVCSAAGLALENERLHAELRARVAEVRASRARLVQASDDARRRLERDLHDGAQQRLVALSVNLRLARSALETDPQGAAELLDECSTELRQATEELRELARGIHPAVLTDRGLEAAVGALAARSSLPVEVEAVPEERLPAPVEAAAYFVVAEALTNVARYSDATHAQVRVERVNGSVVVDVADDGKGGADPAQGSGLRGLTDRLAALDGTLAVESPPGSPRRV